MDINVSCSHCNRICSFGKDNTRLYVCSSFLTQVWWLMALVLKTLPENNPSLSEEWKSLSSSYNSRVVGTLVKPLGAIQNWPKLIRLVFKHLLWLYHASYNAAHWHKTRPTIQVVLPTGYQSKPYHFNGSTYVRLYCQLLASHFQSNSSELDNSKHGLNHIISIFSLCLLKEFPVMRKLQSVLVSYFFFMWWMCCPGCWE